jgi:hypothetical protein
MFVLLLACGGPPSPDLRKVAAARAALPKVATSCPTTFAGGVGLCNVGKANCEYPEGVCACVEPDRGCSGTARNEDEQEPRSWSCIPRDRPDGCPGLGTPEGACTTPGKQCHYNNDCCTNSYTCTNGAWVATMHPCPS